MIIYLLIAVFVLFGLSRGLASFWLDWQWWQEVGQVETWVSMLWYGVLPAVAAVIVLFAAFFVAHARGLKAAGTRLRDHSLYARLSTPGLLLLSVFIASLTIDSWTVIRFFGNQAAGPTQGSWRDPVFGNGLGFYFFDLPFYGVLLRVVLTGAALTALIYFVTQRAWSLRGQFSRWGEGGPVALDISDLHLGHALQSFFFRMMAAIFLFALAIRFYLDRYRLLFDDHSALVGIDWVAENIQLPLLWVVIGGCLVAAVAVLAHRPKLALVLPALLVLYGIVPRAVHAVYVRPSEITVQLPYIERHIQATRAAYGLTERSKEIDFAAKMTAPIDPSRHRLLFENVRLWDWRAFHDTVTQIQALRPYYVFPDSDVDRYRLDGQLRQVLLTPRELDVNQLPADARSRWINPHFIYTHGYGVVVAEASRITPDGLPNLLIQDAPPTVKTKSLQLSRPEIYFGETTHEPVYVRTKQPEFNYPQGSGNVETHYEGSGGFPITPFLTRAAAALSTGDWNILLTGYLQDGSRMMIHRRIRDRLQTLAGFVSWDSDPYLVITEAGRLVWLADGYTTSSAHPYSRHVQVEGLGRINYIRNSVKATVDAYDGTIRLYAFDTKDPILRSYSKLLPKLFLDMKEMPAGIRQHLRYPEVIFRVQGEIYRTFHMTDPVAFFNKEDTWDFARNLNNTGGRPEPVAPTYLVTTMPGSDDPEFVLMTSFTPRTKDNLIGIMLARCDGENLGELYFLQLSKQELVFGPMQVEARINQDQTISKDLTLWNQQGSQVLRGQMLVLPVENTLLYIEPIYLQANEARMPQLKKIAMAMGNRLAYADTYEEAQRQLFEDFATSGARSEEAATPSPGAAAPGSEPPRAPVTDPALLQQVRDHLRRYRELMSQGRYAEAGRQIEQLEALAGKQQTPSRQ